MEQIIGLQTTISEAASAGATLTNNEGNVVEAEEVQEQKRQGQSDNEEYQRHIKHQEEVFDQLSDLFFVDPDKEIPTNELDVTYKDMCYDIMFQILLHQKRNEESTNTVLYPQLV